MTPKQRFLAALGREEPDRLPVMYQHLGGADHLMEATGLTLRQGLSDPEAFANISMASHQMFGFDNIMAGWGDLLVEASAFGPKLRYTSDRQYPREDPIPMDQIDQVTEVDPLGHPQWSVPLKAAKLMNERVGKEMLVLGCTSSPFIVAGGVIGYENLLVAQMTEKETVHKLMGKITASEEMLMNELREFAGLEAVFISDALADAEQNTMALSKEFDLAYTKKVVEAAREAGLHTIVHNCSESPYANEEVEAYRPSAMHLPDKWSGLPEMITRMEGKCGLVAGIDHRTLIYKATPERIKIEAKRVGTQLSGLPGLILAPACELAFDTPLGNILAFKDAAHSV
ncbi:MAG TPA: uroporphyrinogen decarboxylase family protein, partial [Methanomassiliicoccales archaeon]|nr:uroporphyrinogen decarboxylase family protein [Methanomassiliicoccales archaeon]